MHIVLTRPVAFSGYGNAAVVSVVGQSLIYTFGFICVILFGHIEWRAGAVTMEIVDDFFERLKLKSLVHGWRPVGIWLLHLIFWLWIGTAATLIVARKLLGMDTSVARAFWFAFISTTTVGFGDGEFFDEIVFIYFDIILILTRS